jgi:hypothetical protein
MAVTSQRGVSPLVRRVLARRIAVVRAERSDLMLLPETRETFISGLFVVDFHRRNY